MTSDSRLGVACGSALTDAQKIKKAIELLEWLHDNCLFPNLAHDAVNTCRICRLITELKVPNDQAHLPAPGGEVERKKDNQI